MAELSSCHLLASSGPPSAWICRASIGSAAPPGPQNFPPQDEDEGGPQRDADHEAHETAAPKGKDKAQQQFRIQEGPTF